MISIRKVFAIFMVLFSVTGFAQQPTENQFSFYWKNGFGVESADKQFRLKFGGRIMVDHGFFSQDNNLDAAFNPLATKSGTELRRARIFTSGNIYGNVAFKLSIDFSDNKTDIKDAYIGIKNIPFIGNIRVGHVKEPFRLDVLSSSKYITFMERSFAVDFLQVRNNGILFFNDFYNKRLSLQLGVFFNEDNSSDDKSANGGHAITTRTTGLLIHKKQELLHTGLAYSYRVPSSKLYRISSRPEGHLSRLKYLFTGPISSVKNMHLFNYEIAYVNKGFAFQAEYLTTKINTGISSHFDTYNFSSYYGQISYFLTGESKVYRSSYGGFGRVHPIKNFNKDGLGAWEIAFRYSNADLNDEDVFGGEQTNYTLGLNWYLNPSVRFMVNNVFSSIKGKGNANVFQFRLQIDF